MAEKAQFGVSSKAEMGFASLGQWKVFVEGHAESTPMHCAAWLRLLEKAYRMRLRIPALLDRGRVLAGMPFLETRRPFAQRAAVAAPFCDWLYPLAVSADALECFRQALPGLLQTEYETAVMHTTRPFGGFPVVQKRVRHALNVDRPYAEVAKGFIRGTANKLRKADRVGFRYRVSTARQAFDEFRQLNTLNRRARGLPAQPRLFFSLFFDEIVQHGLGFTSIAELDGKVAAAAVFLVFHKISMNKYSASDPAYRKLLPNDFLIAHAIRDATESDITCFDFGATETSNAGLRHFKNKWGSCESPVVSEYVVGQPVGGDGSRASTRLRQSLGVAIRLAPPFCCTLCGDVLYRYSSGNSW